VRISFPAYCIAQGGRRRKLILVIYMTLIPSLLGRVAVHFSSHKCCKGGRDNIIWFSSSYCSLSGSVVDLESACSSSQVAAWSCGSTELCAYLVFSFLLKIWSSRLSLGFYYFSKIVCRYWGWIRMPGVSLRWNVDGWTGERTGKRGCWGRVNSIRGHIDAPSHSWTQLGFNELHLMTPVIKC